MSLLQDVLRTQTLDSLDKKLGSVSIGDRPGHSHQEEDEDELVNVVSLPGTPNVRSRPSSRPGSRPGSPTRSSNRPVRGPLHLTAAAPHTSADPLKAFPTELSQRIFGRLRVKDLANCSRVSRKWLKSQTLNYGPSIPSFSCSLHLIAD